MLKQLAALSARNKVINRITHKLSVFMLLCRLDVMFVLFIKMNMEYSYLKRGYLAGYYGISHGQSLNDLHTRLHTHTWPLTTGRPTVDKCIYLYMLEI